MKKILSVIIALAMIFALCACGTAQGGGAAQRGGTTDPAGADAQYSGQTEATQPAKTEDLSLYEKFLQNDAKLYEDKFTNTSAGYEYDGPIIESKEGLTLSEMVVQLSKRAYIMMPQLSEINSCYIDCGGDGVPELVVEVIFADSYQDLLTREVIIKEIDGKLQLCYVTETYYRYYEHLASKNGLIISGGSGGASSYAEAYGVIDADGQYHDVYYEDGEYWMGAYYPEGSKLQEVASQYADDISDMALLRIITLYDKDGNEDQIVYGADPADDEMILKIFDEAQEKLTSSEEIDKLIEERLAVYGVKPGEESLDWVPVDFDSVGLGDVARYGFNPVFVSTVDELVNAIDNDVTIILAPGEYNLTQWLYEHDTALELYCEQTAGTIQGACNAVYEDSEFGIVNISGMTIVSQDADNPAYIVSEPRYCNVIHFFGCSDNYLRNLVIGHTEESGTCSGDVLAFSDSYGNRIEGCDLYGCGAYGIFADSSSDLRCENTVIHDCTYGLIEAYNGSYLTFADCSFKYCEGYDMINLSGSSAYFSGCDFSDLTPNMLWMDEESYATFCSCMFDVACAESVNSYSGSGTVTVY